MPPVLHWIRRDLRISDNTALYSAFKTGQPVVPVYLTSTWRNSHAWTGAARQSFLAGCLASLSANLEQIGGRLIIRNGPTAEGLIRLALETGATAVYYNRDPDPFGRAQEDQLERLGRQHGIAFHGFKDITLHERSEVLTAQGNPYRVFTPYSKSWRALDKPSPLPSPGSLRTPENISSEPVPLITHWFSKPRPVAIVEPGEKAARKRMTAFLNGPVSVYGKQRNFPAGKTTSTLSADLRFGTISIRTLYKKCREAMEQSETPEERTSINTYINELIWREFYMQILWFWPEVLETEFQPKYRNLQWLDKGHRFERWSNGETGFPIVDAAMRQLHATGFMHNRLRMITAMFLTKDLHIDWRHGEQFFMQQLTDGDIAANNGGWQWSAGTGADAAPYFRIQNPWTQSERFDPSGEWIRQWLPELRDVPPEKLHAPPDSSFPIAKGHPLPMVNHQREREVTLQMFQRDAIDS